MGIKLYFLINLIDVAFVDILGILQGIQEAKHITKMDKARKASAFSNMVISFFLGGILCLIGEVISKIFGPIAAVALLIPGLLLISYGIFRNIFVIMKFAELQDKG